MTGTYFEDRDGTEHVTFSDREWEIMLADPAFGYVCSNGHRLTPADQRNGGCSACEADAYERLDRALALQEARS